MIKTVDEAFQFFLKEYINIDPEKSKKAKSSRDWLVSQINSFPSKDENFPQLYEDMNIFYGSFTRKTKKRPLDDIDIMIAISANGCSYTEYSDRIEISLPGSDNYFRSFCFDDTLVLNSRKIINLFLSKLNNIPQYDNAEIKRNLEAATLRLKSYEWNFDIVPCFFTKPDTVGRTYYLIPDGEGHWKKTDPRIDRDRIKKIGRKHEGRIYNVIRIIKYWNKRATMPSISSYLLENMILQYYENNDSSSYIDFEIRDVITYLLNNVQRPVDDPKKIQGNLNRLSVEEIGKLKDRCRLDLEKISAARDFEDASKQKEAINKWKEVFGNEFPSYE